ncbi:MAG TPA: pyridoxal 5'-phosphate synthase glutaminase subunit PdxT [Caldisericia bacterium]|nr:pyridoxal 5'-phosphate synthase glutaminase subunit PdxT [Caldisericia bacterium]HQL66122.1 pyridoxal 5'-phosphate synthase glutaminase subunit PdxT [Caldisericia bacterium]
MQVGVLSLQGSFIEHINILNKIPGVNGVQVKKKDDLKKIDGLIIPGGESTTIGKLLERYDLLNPLKNMISEGFPVLGTCAGFILLSKRIFQENDQPLLGVFDITIKRNAFGTQINSMEIDLKIKNFEIPYKAIFIRAPVVKEIGDSVEVLAEVEEGPVFIKQGNILGASFHPELTDDTRIHQMFIDIINKRR